MIVDVLYEGLALAKGAEARSEGDALFVELESPMPVGTRLVIRTPDGERAGRVAQVNEGLKSGVTVRFGAAPAKVEDAAPKHIDSDEDDASHDPEPPDPKESPDSKKGGRKRRNTRKTVMGH